MRRSRIRRRSADASAILERIAADETAARLARTRYRSQRMRTLEPDAHIASLLASDERVLAFRGTVLFDRRQWGPGEVGFTGVAGNLYLTTRRIVLMGRLTLSYALDDIEEAVVAGERLLLVMRDGIGVALDTPQPRLLRVEIAAARALSRG